MTAKLKYKVSLPPSMSARMMSRKEFLREFLYGAIGAFIPKNIKYVPFVSKGDINSRAISLTFDDGWTESGIVSVLRALESYQLKTDFFVVGAVLSQFKDIWKSALDYGHSIHNHTLNHDMLGSPDTNIERAVLGFEEQYTKNLGRDYGPLKLLRPPALDGVNNKTLYNVLARHGYSAVVGWTAGAASYDTSLVNDKEGSKKIISNLEKAADGSICLFHFLEVTGAALPELIENAWERGQGIVPLQNLPGTTFYNAPSKKTGDLYDQLFGCPVRTVHCDQVPR
jgi:peptidoglycan-N-acetylglucosamine deacetylase